MNTVPMDDGALAHDLSGASTSLDQTDGAGIPGAGSFVTSLNTGDRQTTPSRAGGSGPTVLRIGLGGALRRKREAAGITREAAGDAIRGSTAKISRLELGRVGFKERDVADLLTLYKVLEQGERNQFMELVRQANTPGWWHRYTDLLPAWFETYLGMEQAAAVIRTYELQWVPGLFQTRDYATAVTRLAHSDAADVDRRVELRMLRQRQLTAPDGPRLWAVVDEAALRRVIADRSVFRAQLEHLLALAELPNVTLQVAPLAFGGHAAAGGPFSVLRFAQPDLPDIVYLEQLTSALYLDKRTEVDHYVGVMDRLVSHVEPPTRTTALLTRYRDEL